jgi:2-succinyl-5-enolpyruvyl-6-hydroxy-3-cyclohexene-1-carboxylate synthase
LFDLLPQSEHAPSFERLFIAPHAVDVAGLATACGVDSAIVEQVDEVRAKVPEMLETGGAHVLVVPVEREADLKTRRGLDDAARAVCAGLQGKAIS